jgi:hypothetical protein
MRVPIADAAGVVALPRIGRRGDAQVRALATHQRRDDGGIASVATDQPVPADDPDIARAGHGRDRRCGLVVLTAVFVAVVDRVGVGVAAFVVCRVRSTRYRFRLAARRVAVFHQVEQALDLAGGKAGHVQVETDVGEVGQFQHQQRLIPTGIEGDSVVGDHQRALLRRTQVRQFDHRHLGHAEPARGE